MNISVLLPDSISLSLYCLHFCTHTVTMIFSATSCTLLVLGWASSGNILGATVFTVVMGNFSAFNVLHRPLFCLTDLFKANNSLHFFCLFLLEPVPFALFAPLLLYQHRPCSIVTLLGCLIRMRSLSISDILSSTLILFLKCSLSLCLFLCSHMHWL